jgi:thiamine pyrophosphate-dependent acetolactate synthase large subunit-like protein
MKSSVLQRIQEIYRTTAKGRKVQWDEPTEDNTPEVRRHNAFLAQKLQRKQDAQDRLKSKGAVPTRNGKPIFEGDLVVTEDVSQVLMSFRRHYQSNRPMRFRDWIKIVSGLMDDLT